MGKRVRIGDILEVGTSRGLGYIQVTHHHKQYGHLIRVLPGFRDARPNDFEALAALPTRFVTFIPAQAIVNQQIWPVVASEPVPSFAQGFPLFRAGAIGPGGAKPSTWWLWDGTKEWRVGSLTADQRKYPLRGIWNDTLLIERMASDWGQDQEP
jgi:hypothetical protein